MVDHEPSGWNDLLKRAKAGDRRAKGDLYRQLAVRLRPLVKYRLWGWSDDEHEDIIQDTLITLLEKMDALAQDPVKYTMKILRNKIGNAYQSKQSQQKNIRISDENDIIQKGDITAPKAASISADDTFIAELEAKDLTKHIREAVKRLPAFCRIFFFAVMEGRKVQELWKLFKKIEPDLKRNNFDKRIYRCRMRLMVSVQDYI